ncbi:class I SAM-dependent methyltransferase [Lolliginicoccus suaedae]|uniref:class I SAM-dependent methyltransferase n=1 Tax=Lolliginicoccus suaedae TaxID=2605429 RepID=UPI0011EDCF9F|nr:class I SAM-dependent methyltransferase [Lolliginicoccus suaedae]
MPAIFPSKYTVSARFYDAISAEWPVYGAGREAAIPLLRLDEGAQVLDIGCGTGLNFPGLQQRIGPGGRIIGVDASAHMGEQARRKARRRGWSNVQVLEEDATTVSAARLREQVGGAGYDAVIASYALSLMDDWPAALATMVAACRPGARVAIIDMQPPQGRAAVWSPLARLACRAGGSDIHARPWTLLDQYCEDIAARSVRGGHIQVRVGTVR